MGICEHGFDTSIWCTGCTHSNDKSTCQPCLSRKCNHGMIKFDCERCNGYYHPCANPKCVKCSGCYHSIIKQDCERCN